MDCPSRAIATLTVPVTCSSSTTARSGAAPATPLIVGGPSSVNPCSTPAGALAYHSVSGPYRYSTRVRVDTGATRANVVS